MTDTAPLRPLSGVRVFELGIAIAAPSCTRQLAMFGADVLKIESLTHPDVIRLFGTVWTRDNPALAAVNPDLSAYVSEMATGKRGVGLDLKHPDGRAAADKILATCDVLVTNYSAPAVRSLGLDYESVRAVRPDIIYVALPGFGSDPTMPYYENIAWGPNQAPLVGLDHLTGHPEHDAAGIGPIAPPDYCSGMIASFAVLAGLRHRALTGEGVFVDISQFEASVGLLGPLFVDMSLRGREQTRTGNRCGSAAPEGVYRCRGADRWVAITVGDDDAWWRLGGLVQRDGTAVWTADSRFAQVAGRRAHHDEIDELLSCWTAAHSPEEVAAWCQEAGVAAYAVLDLDDIPADPQIRDRQFFGVAPSAHLVRDVFHASALRLTETPPSVGWAGAVRGEATRVVLADVGYDADAIDGLLASNAAYVASAIEPKLRRPYDPCIPTLFPASRPGVLPSVPSASGPAATARPAVSRGEVVPAKGAISAGLGPLTGLRVVDFGGIGSAYGSMILAGLGAEVTLIEPHVGDPLRRAGDEEDGSSSWFAFLGQGKRSIVADLHEDADRARVAELIADADIVLDSTGVGCLEHLGLSYEAAKSTNPGLVWVSITPFGLTGPRRNWKGSNVVAWASAGVLGLNGFPDQAPVTPGGPVQLAHHVTSMQAAIAALLAVQARDRADGLGHGQLVDISMQECCLQLAPETGITLYLDDQIPRIRSGNRRLLSRPWGHYKCQDGAVGTIVLQPGHWINTAQWIAEVTGNDMFTDDVFREVSMRAEIAELVDEFFEQVTMTSTKRELFTEGQRRNVPVTPVNTLVDLRSDPHLAATGFFETIEHPELGRYDRPGPPMRTNRAWWSLARAPLLGEHTDADSTPS